MSKNNFAAMDPEKQREIASQGGRAAQASGKAHKFTEGNQPRPKGWSFRRIVLRLSTVSCFDRALYKRSRPQADTRDSQAFETSEVTPSPR